MFKIVFSNMFFRFTDISQNYRRINFIENRSEKKFRIHFFTHFSGIAGHESE